LGMKVLLNDPPRVRIEGKTIFTDLEIILKEADIITFHVPLTYGGVDKTFHLFDPTFVDKLTKPIIIFNTSRGPVMDSEAFKYGKEQGKITHAILDVWEGEPHIDPKILELASIGTPHIAGYSIEGKAKATEKVVQSVCEFLNLPLKNWKPDLGLKKEILEIDLTDLKEQPSLQKVFRAVYDIQKDDEMLRKNPSDFEHVRGSYAFRRENSGYILILKNLNQNIVQVLSELGFKIEE